MKNRNRALLAAAGALSLVLAACGGADAPAAPSPSPEAPATAAPETAASVPVTLTMAHYLPDGGTTWIENRFAEYLTEYSDGSVSIDFSWGAALGGAAELPFLAEAGAVDMAVVVPAFVPDAFPNNAVTMMLYWSAGDTATDLRRQNDLILETHGLPLFEKEREEYNLRRLLTQPLSAYFFWGNDENCSVEALAGQRMRSLGRDVPRAFEVRNITPLPMTTPEMFEGLERKTVDRITLPADSFIDQGFAEIANQGCGSVFWLGAGHQLVINEDSWNGLDEAQRDAMLRAATQAQSESLDRYLAVSDADIERITAAGVNLQSFTAEDLASWQADSPDFPTEWRDGRLAAGEDAALVQEVYEKILEIAARTY